MGKHETIIPDKPPEARAPAVTEHLQACKRTLAALEAQIPAAALAAALGEPDGTENLAALYQKIAVTKFQIENYPAARLLAERLDQEATVAYVAAVQTLSPSEIVEGLTKETCCRRCIPGISCAITASDLASGTCQHPLIGGALDQLRYRSSPKILALYDSACRKLGLMRKLHA
jgi:hypothetical protein